jgi:hypothetical protein
VCNRNLTAEARVAALQTEVATMRWRLRQCVPDESVTLTPLDATSVTRALGMRLVP